MRRWIGAVGIILVLGLAAWAWPLVGALQLARAAQAGDTAEVFDRVDVDVLRRSLARQIALAYLEVSGKSKKLGAFGRSLAGAAVTTVADPYVAELLTPENITALLSQGRINKVTLGTQTVAVRSELPDFPKLMNADLLSVITGSYFDQLNDFLIPVDGGHGPNDHYGIHMRRSGLTWKLGGLDLPASLVDDMARSLLEGEKTASP